MALIDNKDKTELDQIYSSLGFCAEAHIWFDQYLCDLGSSEKLSVRPMLKRKNKKKIYFADFSCLCWLSLANSSKTC